MQSEPGVVENFCNSSTWEAEAAGLWVWGQPGLHSEYEASLGYIAKCLKKKNCKMKGQFFS
jgi:hypothetical protein